MQMTNNKYRKPWSEQDRQFLIDNYGKYSAQEKRSQNYSEFIQMAYDIVYHQEKLKNTGSV